MIVKNIIIVIFSCETNLTVLQEMDTIFVDGTFDYCAKFFSQLFTVHGIQNGHYVQLCHALLPNKSIPSYKVFLEKLIEICPLAPTTAVVDFETAIHASLLSISGLI